MKSPGKTMLPVLISIAAIALSPILSYAQGGGINNKWGGRILLDAGQYQQEDIARTGIEIRSAQVHTKGALSENTYYKLQLEFANGKVSFMDAFLRLQHLPVIEGALTIGHQNDPLGIEQISSPLHIPFMERALPNTLYHKRSTGIGYSHLHLLDDALALQVAYLYDMGNTIKAPDLRSVAKIMTIQLSTTPRHSESDLWHTGLGYSHRTSNSNDLHYGIRPEAHLSPSIFTIPLEKVYRYELIHLDVFRILNAVTIRGEYMQGQYFNEGIKKTGTTISFMASYFLTGEHSVFRNAQSGFSAVKPNSPFSPANGQWGAWQIALRYSALDFSRVVSEAKMADLTASITLYLNLHARLMYNFVLFRSGADQGRHIHQFRCQVAF